MSKDYTNKRERRDDNKFEFKLTINDHIICQRYFPINDHDKEETYDVKSMMDELTGMNNNGQMGSLGIIPNFLKEQSVNYIWKNYDPYEKQAPENIDRRGIFDNEDTIGFELRCDGRLVAKSAFSGNYFPTKVRYNINIKGIHDKDGNVILKGIIPEILSQVREYMSTPVED
tara:strand:+ start:14226 stop:14741 length:516 start_codon:yes stop_codon:yes gene_type:complete